MSPMPPQLHLVIKLALAILLGGLVGLEREFRQKPAGLRTNILINLGSTAIMIVSIEVVRRFGTGDPSRIAAQIVAGIGFLGAGTILRSGVSVQGLTTAATIWVNAGIGMAIGAELYLEAVAATVASILVLTMLSRVEHLLRTKGEARLFRLVAERSPEILERIREIFRRAGVGEEDHELHVVSDRVEFVFALPGAHGARDQLVRELLGLSGVKELRSVNGIGL